MDWYKFKIKDFQEKVTGFGAADELIYRRLIDLYYLTEAPLSNDMSQLADRIHMDDKENIKAVLEACFVLMDDNKWHDHEIDSEIGRRQRNLKLIRENGRLGGRPKKVTQVEKSV